VAATGSLAREVSAADVRAENYPTVQALSFMSRPIAEESGARHQIRVIHSRELGEERKSSGTVVPAIDVLAMPFLIRSADHLQKSADDQRMFWGAALRSSRFMREKWRDIAEHFRRQAEAAGVALAEDFDRRPFEQAAAGFYQEIERDPPAAKLTRVFVKWSDPVW
jgi:TRAP-type C4-dicarboxylate transport system substrate-binding protein